MSEKKLNLKGAAWKPIVKFVKVTFGNEAFTRVLESVSPPCREIASETILVNNWYEMSLIEEFISTADKLLGSGDLTIARKMGQYSAEFGIKTVYKVFMKVGTPEFVIKRAPVIWNRYYSKGKLEALVLEKGHVVLRLTDIGSISKVTCVRVTGWMEMTLKMSGAINSVVQHISCQSRGGSFEEWEGRWE